MCPSQEEGHKLANAFHILSLFIECSGSHKVEYHRMLSVEFLFVVKCAKRCKTMAIELR